jgi:hypothetical protein
MNVVRSSCLLAIALLGPLMPSPSFAAISSEELHFRTAKLIPPQRCEVDETAVLDTSEDPTWVGRISDPTGYRLDTIENVVSQLPAKEALSLITMQLHKLTFSTGVQRFSDFANEIYRVSHDTSTLEAIEVDPETAKTLLVGGIRMLQSIVEVRLQENPESVWGSQGLIFLRSVSDDPEKYVSWDSCETSSLHGIPWTCGGASYSFSYLPETKRFTASYTKGWLHDEAESAAIYLGKCKPYYD